MYTAQYSCSKSYFHFEVPEELPEEGLLEGNSGKIRFKRVQDGLAVYDSTLLTSGFLCSGDCDAIYVPHTINQLPVTELHQSIVPRPGASLCIENGNLKRVFLEISQNSIRTRAADTDSITNIVSLYLMLEKENRPQNVPPEVKIDFVGSPTNEVDFCSINCHDRLVLHIPSAKAVKVNANQTELRGEVPACVEQITFYPMASRKSRRMPSAIAVLSRISIFPTRYRQSELMRSMAVLAFPPSTFLQILNTSRKVCLTAANP